MARRGIRPPEASAGGSRRDPEFWYRFWGVRRRETTWSATSSFFETAAQRGFVVLGATLPISTSATEIVTIAVLVLWLLSLVFRDDVINLLRGAVRGVRRGSSCRGGGQPGDDRSGGAIASARPRHGQHAHGAPIDAGAACVRASIARFPLRAGWQRITHAHPLNRWGLVMFGILSVGCLWSSAPWDETVVQLAGYRRFLYPLLFLPLLKEEWPRRWALKAFLGSMLLTLAASFLMQWGIIDRAWGWGDAENCAVFKNHITQNLLMAMTVAILWLWPRWVPGRRWLYVVAVALAVYSIIFMVDGRTGYLALGAIVATVFHERGGWRGLLLGALVVVAAAGAFHACSANFRDRVDRVGRETAQFLRTDGRPDHTSVGFRLLFAEKGMEIIADHPWFGAGTGSFRTEFRRRFSHYPEMSFTHPHNEYLHILAQVGPIGLACLLCWFGAIWQAGGRCGSPWKELVRVLVAAYLVGCLFNTLMLDVTESSFFVYLASICLAARPTSRGTGRTDNGCRADRPRPRDDTAR